MPTTTNLLYKMCQNHFHIRTFCTTSLLTSLTLYTSLSCLRAFAAKLSNNAKCAIIKTSKNKTVFKQVNEELFTNRFPQQYLAPISTFHVYKSTDGLLIVISVH